MSLGEIITLVAYAIGTGIIVLWKNQKLKALATQVSAQKGIMSEMERFFRIFNVDQVEGYVQLVKNKSQLEMEEAKKNIENEWEQKTKEGATILVREMSALLGVVINFVYAFGDNSNTERILNEMKDGSISKDRLLQSYNENKQYLTKLRHKFLLDLLEVEPPNLIDQSADKK